MNSKVVVPVIAVAIAAAVAAVAWFRSAKPAADVAAGQPAASVAPAPPMAPFEPSEPVPEPVPVEAAQPAAAAAPESGEPSTAPATAPAAAADDGHGHDEEPGQLAPETIEAIREIRKPAPGEGEVTDMPDGSKRLNLGNRYMSVPVATVGPDGKVRVNYHGESLVPPETPPAPATATPATTGEQQQ